MKYFLKECKFFRVVSLKKIQKHLHTLFLNEIILIHILNIRLFTRLLG